LKDREAQWADLMRAALTGDGAAYERCLREMAVHLKRQTWDATRAIGPWISGIARYKIIDAARRRGRRIDLSIDEFADILPAEAEPETMTDRDVTRSLEALPEGQRKVVRAIAIDGVSIAATAQTFNMSEGAVRVALHRGLGALAKRHRDET
jgi:RNA polymerase sigma-70 factor (ECF subfamily)